MGKTKSRHCFFCWTIIMMLIFVSMGWGASPQQKDQKKIKKYFKMDLYELMGVEMTTAGKQKEKISEIPASVILVTREDIKRYGYTSLIEILQNIPGLYMIDDYNWMGTKNFGVRGFFSTGSFNDMIVLINGVNQVENIFDSYFTERIAVPVEAIDRIEVIRGPMSVIYGSGAFFGAINIITLDAEDKNPGSMISTTVGSLGTTKLFARFSGRKGDFRYSVNASIYSENGIDEPFGKMMTDPSVVTLPLWEYGWHLDSDRTGGLLKTNRKYFNFFGQLGDFTFDFGLVGSEKNTIESIASAGEGTATHLTSGHASLKYMKKLSEVVSLEGKFTYSLHTHWLDNDFFFANSFTNQIIRMGSYEVELNAFINPFPNFDITMGLFRHTSWDSWSIDYPFISGGSNMEILSDDRTIHAFYTQVNYNISEKLKLVAGLRLEKPEDYTLRRYENPDPFAAPLEYAYHHEPTRDLELIPRLALIYSPDDNHSIKLLYGKAIKQPSRQSDVDLSFVANPIALKAAEIHTYELNYIAAISKHLLVNVSIFRNELNNLISRTNVIDPGTGDWAIQSTNAGEMSTNGLELGLLATLGKKLEFDISATYQSSKNKRPNFEDIKLGYFPKLLGYVKVSYNISKNITAALTGIYVDKMEAGWNLENMDVNNVPFIPPGDPYQGRLGFAVDGYFNVNANLRINKLFNTGLFLNARVSNLFDEEIYYPTTTSNTSFDKGTLGYGRRFLVSVGYEF